MKMTKAAKNRRERLSYVLQGKKLRTSDRKDVLDLLREPEMQRKIQETAAHLFGGFSKKGKDKNGI